ncbi:MAG: hypothetical protein AAGI71_07780 [Bacteroidota bacterium]
MNPSQTDWNRLRNRLVGLLVLVVFGAADAQAQLRPGFFDYVRSSLDWYTVETPNFQVHFHADEEGGGATRTAQVVARIAEDVYGPITELYGYEPDTKVSIVLKDYEDYSNGAAYFFDNKIEIWAPALMTPLRGDHNWLRNVITHEFTHIVQVQKTMKANRRLPFLYLQVLDYEDVRRPDVLYGFPNVLVTYPVPILNNPAWLAEGTAQYQRTGLRYDRWDTHRDMFFRMRVLAGKELDLEGMGGFYSHSSLMREGVYNHGFAFTRYLAHTYGEEVLRDLSDALSSWTNWNVERALKEVTGERASDVYAAWMQEVRDAYEAQAALVQAREVSGELIEDEGFSNFHPQFSPDGTRLAYVSNKGEHFNRSSLYVRDLTAGTWVAHDLGPGAFVERTHVCSMGHKVRSGVGGAFGWHPDGNALVYTRVKDTADGRLVADLYRYDLEARSQERLTTDARATHPRYSPDGTRIAYVQQSDGSTNLMVLHLADQRVEQLTNFQNGEQVSDPAWNPAGTTVAFSRSGLDHGRDLYQVDVATRTMRPLRATPADERDPAWGPDGRYLYFSADDTGIFNLYRLPVDGGPAELLTQVVGGAFMPHVRADGAVAFARFEAEGYKVAWLESPVPLDPPRLAYQPPSVLMKPGEAFIGPDPAPRVASAPMAARTFEALNEADDSAVRPLAPGVIEEVRQEGSAILEVTRGGPRATPAPAPTAPPSEASTAPLAVRPYGNVFTSFSFYPALRLDQYVTRRRSRLESRLPDRTRAETLLRNTKVGIYANSREMLEGMTLFGGLLVGPASRDAESVSDFFAPSRLLGLERDAFLLFEYKKGLLGLLPQRWAPQWAIELYNIRRNVENGLSIEEFPCTSCFPETTFADIAYALWEGNLFARSKVNRFLLLEAGYRYSPYRVITERFFSREEDLTIPSSSARYYIGRAFLLNAYFEARRPHREMDVIPDGLRADVRYEVERGRLLDRFDVESGLLVPRYERFLNHRITLDARYSTVLPGRPLGGTHGVGLRLRGSTILGGEVDDFYHDFIGGLIGARGYPFYGLGGNETAWLQASYTFPVFPRIERQVLFAYIDKVYARVYADAALAWSGPVPGLDEVRRDVGGELRFSLGSFYLLPTAFFVSATYGLDAFDFELDEGFVTPDGSNVVRYGQQWQWHMGVLFDFDL